MKAHAMLTLPILIVLAAAALAFAFAEHRQGVAEKHTNALINETSPYLLQHAHNPVAWHPWGKEAFEKAKREDKPIFLSVGYSTCHWCHVMAHESFEDEQVAAVMNEHFISIKVDREELPDVDEQYMLATQLMTRRGGWPNSVVLTLDGRPWFAGTYYPKDRFIPLLNELAKVWKAQRPQVEEQADRLSEAIRQVAAGRGPGGRTPPLSPQLIGKVARELRSGYDPEHGGFGDRPKFPPHGTLAVLLDVQERTNDLSDLAAITHTLDAMSLGGIYDHIGGGFHRYSTDARWFLPHFEKMLYDNAQLIRAYTDAYRLTGHEDYKRVVAETFDWLRREMTDPAGGFYSALDADSEGEEGKFYVWTYQEVVDALGEQDAGLFTDTYNITREGTYHEEATGHSTGANIPYLSRPLPDDPALRQRLADMRGKLLDARAKRVRPHLDDKVLASWNGLMIGALAHAGRVLQEPRYTQAAAAAADFVLAHMRKDDGTLLRTWRKGEAKLPAYLEDYAFFIDGLLHLHEATGDARYLDAAKSLTDIMVTEFHDAKDGGFYATSEDHDRLLARIKEAGGGGNMPSANGVAADALLRLSIATADPRYADLAAGTLRHLAYMIHSQSHGSESLVVALSHYYSAAERHPELKLLDRLNPPKAAPTADAVAGESPVIVEAFASRNEVAPGSAFHIAVRMNIEQGYHIYAHNIDPKTMLIGTAIEAVPTSALRVGAPRWPEPRKTMDPVLKSEILTYEGTQTVLIPVEAPADAPEGKTDLTLRFKAQACDEEACYPPVDHTLTIPITIRRGAEPGQPRHREVFTGLGVD